MAILIEAISVVIKAKPLLEKYPGGWEKFKENVPNQTLCADGELIRVGFMNPNDVEKYILSLEKVGLAFLENEISQDIVVVDQRTGPTKNCSWVEFGKINVDGNSEKKISACRYLNSKSKQVITPDNWKYEGSLSEENTFVDSNDVNKRMIRFKNEDGVQTYFDLKTGNDLYHGRTNDE